MIASIYIDAIWIATCQGPPPGGKGPPPVSNVFCNTDGTNGTYREELVTINGTLVREIIGTGCANHPTVLIAPNPNRPRADSRTRVVPAYPCLSDMPPYNLSCQPGTHSLTLFHVKQHK